METSAAIFSAHRISYLGMELRDNTKRAKGSFFFVRLSNLVRDASGKFWMFLSGTKHSSFPLVVDGSPVAGA